MKGEALSASPRDKLAASRTRESRMERGLYEQLVTEGLQRRLEAIADDEARTRLVDSGDQPMSFPVTSRRLCIRHWPPPPTRNEG
jgi:hypothetical protein